MAERTPPKLPRRAYQRADAPGFTYLGNSYDGFSDRPELPNDIRQQIARWAVASEAASGSQRALLAQGSPDQGVARPELLDLLERENRLLDEPSFSAALEHLSEEERLHILRPHVVLHRGFVWPLRIKEAAQVLGDVTEHQLRDWDDAGICRAARWGKGRYRGYFRSQLLLARLIRTALARGYGVERLREDLGLAEKPTAARDVVAVVRAVTEDHEALSA